MRFAFRELPAAGGGVLTPRPVVDISLEGLDAAPVGLAGIELSDAPTEDFFIGGFKTAGALARVNLTVTDGADEFSWDAPVWFCEP